MAINPISGLNPLNNIGQLETKGSESTTNVVKNFSDFLNDALNKVSDLQLESQRITNDFAAGKIDNIHDVMIAGEKADIALQFTLQIRNKILDAYNEIMRMQI